AIRVPAHPTAHKLLSAFGGGIAAPSANPSGKVSPTTAQHVLDGLQDRIAAVLDDGACEVGVESTIIGFDDGRAVLLRPGGLPIEDIAACLGYQPLPPQSEEITAPGQLTSHYAPDCQMRLNAETPDADEAYLAFGPTASFPATLNLSPTADLREAAANLFAYLREIDAVAKSAGLKKIAVARVPETGLGRAINDRLRRAAAPRPA
ncbi:MAG TPA: Sua5 family C-terminal domain-containing protein, partial [Paracoccaceae bacterium]|nr:Sua5 family C-terminal domain-containing protein [Paracoccaceae bacterium]